MLWAWAYAHVVLSPGLSPDLEGEDLLLDGRIVGLVEERRHSIRFLFELVDDPAGVPNHLGLNWVPHRGPARSGRAVAFYSAPEGGERLSESRWLQL